SFVYVSTAFSNCVHETIDEIHYKPPLDCDKLLTLVDCLDNDMLKEVEPILRGKWPNNYTFSKVTAENVVLKYAEDYPVGIVRPSIAVRPIAASTSVGVVHVTLARPEYNIEAIPADYVVSNIIAAAWDINKRNALAKMEKKTDMRDEERVPVYNQVSSARNPYTWGLFRAVTTAAASEYRSTRMIWCYWVLVATQPFAYKLLDFLFHIVCI
ncbi:putative fatty acyl-CoA reductase CG5065, partial [Augochlora pura]